MSRFLSVSTRRWSFESAAFWALLATVFLAVVAFVPLAAVPFLYTKASVFALGVIVTFILYVLARLTLGNIVAPPLPLLGALWLVPIAYGISTIFSSAPATISVFGHAFETDTFGFMLIAGFLGALAALVVRRAEQYRSFLRTGATLVGVVLLAQLAILVVGNVSSSIDPAFSIVGSFADLAALLGLGVVMTLLASRFLQLSSRVSAMLGVMTVVALFFLALANNTLTWVLVGLTALGLFVEGVMRRVSNASETSFELDEVDADDEEVEVTTEEVVFDEGGTSRSQIGMPLVVLAVSVFFIIGGSTVAGVLDNALKVQMLDVRPSWGATIGVGKQTYKTEALFGSGPNTFSQQWLAFRDASINTTQFWNTDFSNGIGFVPTSFVTTGVVGMLAWLLFFGALLFFGLRALLMREAEDPSMRAIAVVTFVGTVYLMLQLIFQVPGPALIVLAFVLAGLFASVLRYFEPRGQVGVTFAQSPRIGFVIVFALTLLLLASVGAAYLVVERYIAQVDMLRVSNAVSAGDLETADAAAAQALLLVASDDAYRAEALIGTARMSQLIQSASAQSTSKVQQELQSLISKSVSAGQAAVKLNPDEYRNWFVLGSVYQTVVPLKVQGAYEAAKEAYGKAQALDPTSPVIPFTLAQLAIANQSYADAEPLLQKAIALKADYTQAIFLLSQLEAQLGKSDEALKEAESAAYFAPNDPSVLLQVGVLREGKGDFAGAIDALSQAVALNPTYANARYFLAVAYANANQYAQAADQLRAVSKLSAENAQAVAANIAALDNGTNPFVQTASTKSSLNADTLPTLSGKQ
ncbi:MAG TPA: tetratricopeptide repeat protein [Candidatus Paceibacterota bacterium]